MPGTPEVALGISHLSAILKLSFADRNIIFSGSIRVWIFGIMI